MKKRLNRMLSTLLICSMVMTLMPTTVFATNRKDAVMEEYAGGLCEHHPEHDDECGYSPATRGTPCEFDCEICGVDDDMKTATPSNAKAVTVAGVQAMIDALPDVEDVRKGNAEKVKAQLDAIDDAKAELSDEEIDELDLFRYMEVAAALEQLLYGVATQSNAVMLADYDGPAIQLGTGGISGPTEEEEEGKVSVRSRYLGDEGMKDLGDFLAAIKEEIKNKTIRKIEVQEENK